MIFREKIFIFKKVLKESSIVTVTEYLMLGTVFLINVILNKYYSIGDVGIFNLYYGIAQVVIVGIGSGLTTILRREIVNNPQQKNKFVLSILIMRLSLSVVCVLLAIIHNFYSSNNEISNVFLLIILISKGFDILNETFYILYQSINKLSYYFFIKSLNAVLLTILIVTCVHYGFSIKMIYFSILSSSSFFFIINCIIYKYRFIQQKCTEVELSEIKKTIPYFFDESWPVVLNGLVFQLSSRVNIFLIIYYSGKEALGVFSTCLMSITIIVGVSNSLGIVLFAKLSIVFKKSRVFFLSTIRKLLLLLLLLGMVMVLVFYFTVPLQIEFLGNLPKGSKKIFIILSLSIPFTFVSGVFGYIPTIIGKQKNAMYLSILILGINILSFYVCTYIFSQDGYSYAYSVSSFIQMVMIYLLIYYSVRSNAK